MAYSKPVNIFDAPQITEFRKPSQEEFSNLEKRDRLGLFPERLLEAYKGFKKKEIARDLGVTSSTITKLLQREQPPSAELLIAISENRKYSIDWLLGGEGEESLESHGFLSETDKKIVEELANIEGKEVADLLQELVGFALSKKAADLLSEYAQLKGNERQILLTIYPLILGDEERAALYHLREKQR